MKQLPGTDLYLPDCDRHFAEPKGGNVTATLHYQHDRITKALSLIRARRVAIDVGAHVGLLTRRLAQFFDHVHAFEPHPENFECLVLNTAHLNNVTLHNKALGNRTGRVQMDSTDTDNSGNRQVIELPDAGVEMITLDSLKLEYLDLLKLDVQGYEYYVLDGARATLRYCRPVCIVEVEDNDLVVQYEHTSKQGVGLLKQAGAIKIDQLGCDQIWTFLGGADSIPFDKYDQAGPYHWEKYEHSQGMVALVNAVVDAVNAGGHDSVLDVGCGDGLYTSMINNAYGIDTSETALKFAREHGVLCENLSAFDVEKLGRRWGAVCLFDTLEHLYDQKRCIETMGRVTDCLYILNPEPDQQRIDGYHTREFRWQDMVTWMSDLGWECVGSNNFVKSRRSHKTLMVFKKKPNELAAG